MNLQIRLFASWLALAVNFNFHEPKDDKAVYYARIKESLGLSYEMVTIPSEVKNITILFQWLSRRGEVWDDEFGGSRPVRAAINLNLALSTAEINQGDEIALFPPVTGG